MDYVTKSRRREYACSSILHQTQVISFELCSSKSRPITCSGQIHSPPLKLQRDFAHSFHLPGREIVMAATPVSEPAAIVLGFLASRNSLWAGRRFAGFFRVAVHHEFRVFSRTANFSSIEMTSNSLKPYGFSQAEGNNPFFSISFGMWRKPLRFHRLWNRISGAIIGPADWPRSEYNGC